jgi:Phosphoserine phosphatase RsbU, N-terminal domain
VSGDRHERFRRDYAPVFLQYLSERGEPGLRSAYELGRRAMVEEMSMLDLVGVHHAVLLDVLRTLKRPEELEDVSQAASEFFVEVLATYEMVQRVMSQPRRGQSG